MRLGMLDTAVISTLSALGWLKQEAHMFKGSLGYIGSLMPAWAA
jgi:hypothetical protein